MLTFIQNAIQAILDAYNGTTTLTKVSVVTIKSEERTLKDYTDAVTLLLVYRDLPSLMPQLPVEDRVQDGTFAVFARADEKEAVQDILNEFINTYNATQQTTIDGIMYFTNAVPFGNSDNIGAVKYSTWQFGIKFRTLQSIYSLYDREIRINSSNNFAKSWTATNQTYYDAQVARNRATSASIRVTTLRKRGRHRIRPITMHKPQRIVAHQRLPSKKGLNLKNRQKTPNHTP